MKRKKEKSVHFIIDQLIKIMNDRKLNKSTFAGLIGFPEAKWNKISNGNQSLSIDEFSFIAEKLQMREVDIFTFPDRLVLPDQKESDVKAQLTIELKEQVKEQVLALIFGNKHVELLKK